MTARDDIARIRAEQRSEIATVLTVSSLYRDRQALIEALNAAEARVRELEAALVDAGDRFATICRNHLAAEHQVIEERKGAEAAEAKLARIRARVERNYFHTRDSLRALLEEP